MGRVIAIIGGLGIAWASAASAQERVARVSGDGILAVEAGGSKVVGDGSDGSVFGFGAAVRGGYRIYIDQVFVTPELQVDFSRWGGSEAAIALGVDSIWVLGVLPGARVGATVQSVSPWFGFHAGYLRAGGSGPLCDQPSSSCGRDHFGFNLGAGLDYTPNLHVSIGPYFAFNLSTSDPSAIKWLTFGLGGTFGL